MKKKRKLNLNEINWEKVFKEHPELSASFEHRIRSVENCEGLLWEPESSGPDPSTIEDDEECLLEWTGTSFEFNRSHIAESSRWDKIRDQEDK
jgi:hypothetical protein